MVVHAISFSEETFLGWRSLIASRLRLLAVSLEDKYKFIEHAHLNPHMFQARDNFPYRVCWFIGIERKSKVDSFIDLLRIKKEFLGKLYNADYTYCTHLHQTDVNLEIINQTNLASYLEDHYEVKHSRECSKVIDSFDDFGAPLGD